MHSALLQGPSGPQSNIDRRTSNEGIVLAAVPYEKWPEWARLVATDRIAVDKGVGDTVRRTIGDAISNTYKNWYQKLFKKSCGCERRQAEWNQKYPYKILDDSGHAA